MEIHERVQTLRGELVALELHTESLAAQIEQATAESRRACRRYKKARRFARRCMVRARESQSIAMAGARAMGLLRGELTQFREQVENAEWQAGKGDPAVLALKQQLRELQQLFVTWSENERT